MNLNSRAYMDGMTWLWVTMLLMLTLVYLMDDDFQFFFIAMIFGIGFILMFRDRQKLRLRQ